MTKFIFVTGGVVSGLGKGITAASLGRLLTESGLTVSVQKLDPYLNVDPGTMNPKEHGEVFVTDDGAETDLDLGHYERFIDIRLKKTASVSSGKLYETVLQYERDGIYLGKTVQLIPHCRDLLCDFIIDNAVSQNPDVAIIEIGGTVGDPEGTMFIEAIRNFPYYQPSDDRKRKNDELRDKPMSDCGDGRVHPSYKPWYADWTPVGKDNCLYIHVALIPYLDFSNEFKTKPAQQSVGLLHSMGLEPNILIARIDKPYKKKPLLSKEVKDKLAMFCRMKPDCIIENPNVSLGIYQAPILFNAQGLDSIVKRELNITAPKPDLTNWLKMLENVARCKDIKDSLKIAIVGKYMYDDSYISIYESLKHAEGQLGVRIVGDDNKNTPVRLDCAEFTEDNISEKLNGFDGILVPGGFGNTGIEGKILAAKYARENNIPYLGLCLGMQVATIEFARNVAGIPDANSVEFAPNGANNVISTMPEQYENIQKNKIGGSMRLGSFDFSATPDTKLAALYSETETKERHRHRFEFNDDYKTRLESCGLVFSAVNASKDADGNTPHIVEAIEIPDKDFFVAVQFHPEFKSRPDKPHPLFVGFLAAAQKRHIS
ncbi:MAG: CTP synthase [Christensenellaceae bacterium]|jgi:CTP synthase|nr:CTP synthase [Christensenellaceae bacterium]